MTAVTALPDMIPKISRDRLSLSLDETAIIINVIPIAPVHPAAAIPNEAYADEEISIPKADDPITKRATPNPAPALIPRIKGSASGFLKRVCICKPQIDRASPANSAVIAFGTLKDQIISRT